MIKKPPAALHWKVLQENILPLITLVSTDLFQ